jgi:hypothetical protein
MLKKCSSGLIKKFFEPKCTCSRTEVEAFIKHVISPWEYEEVTKEILKKLHLWLCLLMHQIMGI